MMEHISTLIPTVGILTIIIIGAFIWAITQIYKFLNNEFVRKLECQKCMIKVKDDVLRDTNEKYKEVLNLIKENHNEWYEEIKSLREAAVKREKALSRIEGKLDTLLDGRR